MLTVQKDYLLTPAVVKTLNNLVNVKQHIYKILVKWGS